MIEIVNIDKDSFGHWLSGFVDGEGCFGIYCYSNKRTNEFNPGALSFEFSIQLREDDRDILEEIQRYFNCGHLAVGSRRKARAEGKVNARDQIKFSCKKLSEILGAIIPHFDEYPLRAKKRGDFEIWKRAVLLQVESARIRGDNNKRICDYPECVAIREQVFALAKELRSTRNPGLQRSTNSLIN